MILLFGAVLTLTSNIKYKMLTAEAPLRILTLDTDKVRLIEPKNINEKDQTKKAVFTLRFVGDYNEGTPIQIHFTPDTYLCRENEETTGIKSCKTKSELTTWNIFSIELNTYMIKQGNKCLYVDKYDDEMRGNLVELVKCDYNDIKQKFKILAAGNDFTISQVSKAGSIEEYQNLQKINGKDEDDSSSLSDNDIVFNKTSIGGNFTAGNATGPTSKPEITVGLGGISTLGNADFSSGPIQVIRSRC